VDFHTKLPALAFLAAMITALLLRDEPGLYRAVRPALARVAGGMLVVVSLGLAWRVAAPLYQAEALRFDSRRAIDRYARTGAGELRDIVAAARRNFTQAVRIDPGNAQAWSDLSYATVQSWQEGGRDLASLGRFAELAADKALGICPMNAEFWVRRGCALDLQRGRPEAEECYRRAVELAPNSPGPWYYYAYHLSVFPARKTEALSAVQTCLTLDPYYRAAEALRQKLAAGH
jgi:tetratricopeptide (TPR) repeat protein